MTAYQSLSVKRYSFQLLKSRNFPAQAGQIINAELPLQSDDIKNYENYLTPEEIQNKNELLKNIKQWEGYWLQSFLNHKKLSTNFIFV